MTRLLQLYKEDQRVISLSKSLSSKVNATVYLENVHGSQDAFILTALNQIDTFNHLYIANDKEEAAYVLNSLSTFEGTKLRFFPDSFKRPAAFDEIDGNNTVERTECANFLNSDVANKIIVTYPEALFEKVVDPHLLDKQRIDLKIGHKLDIDFMIELFVNYGFTRSYFVY